MVPAQKEEKVHGSRIFLAPSLGFCFDRIWFAGIQAQRVSGNARNMISDTCSKKSFNFVEQRL